MAQGLSAKHKSSNGHATRVVPNIDAKELASRPLGPVRVRECNMVLLLGPGCRAEHARPDRLYVN